MLRTHEPPSSISLIEGLNEMKPGGVSIVRADRIGIFVIPNLGNLQTHLAPNVWAARNRQNRGKHRDARERPRTGTHRRQIVSTHSLRHLDAESRKAGQADRGQRTNLIPELRGQLRCRDEDTLNKRPQRRGCHRQMWGFGVVTADGLRAFPAVVVFKRLRKSA
jgi:hypothetical protein